MSTPNPLPKFKLGIALAGAGTGGTYEAGVMDFLLEALEQWEKAIQDNTAPPPRWTVELTDMAGSSAGGITTTLTAAALNSGCEHLSSNNLTEKTAPENNPLYSAWVTKMDYRRMLSTSDIEENGVASSLINANFMQDLAYEVLDEHVGSFPDLPSFASDLLISLTTTNLSGVPYAVKNFTSNSEGGENPNMSYHSDWKTFHLSTSSTGWVGNNSVPLNPMSRCGTDWDDVVTLSQATAAVPLVFPAIGVKNPVKHYDERLDGKPNWNCSNIEKDENKYTAMDGGILNNYPFDLVEKQMKNHHAASQESNGTDFWGATILTIPFPKGATTQTDQSDMGMLGLFLEFIDATRAQAMFKEDYLDEGEDAKHRFILCPVGKEHLVEEDVGEEQEDPKKIILATNTLSGFGGMMDEKIRLHDFMLGRCNCQEFLRHVFFMEENDIPTNDLFKGHKSGRSDGKVQIIPLHGSANNSCPTPVWPSYSIKERNHIIDSISEKAFERFEAIVGSWTGNRKPKENKCTEVNDNEDNEKGGALIKLMLKTIFRNAMAVFPTVLSTGA